MTDGTLFTGKTVEEAVAEGLRSLGMTEQQVEIVVINRGSRGLFGLGSEPAQVRITPRNESPAVPAAVPSRPVVEVPAPQTPEVSSVVAEPARVEASSKETVAEIAPATPTPVVAVKQEELDEEEAQPPLSEDTETIETVEDEELVDLAVQLLSETVRLMGFEATVDASWRAPDADNDDPYLLLNLEGRDLGALIGRRGETLNNLQYLLRLMVNQRTHAWKNIVVDVEHYREHRVEHLTQLALRSAQQVSKSGRALALEPMPPNERRIIHLALRDNQDVYTESSGEGERRKIHILPKRA